MGLACSVLRHIDRLTDKSTWGNRCLPLRSDLECFHRAVEQRAYFAAKSEGSNLPQEVYWNAAKASVALEITGQFDGPFPDRFTPKSAILPLDKEDAELISFVMRFQGVLTNYLTFVQGEVMDYLKEYYALDLRDRKK